MTSPATASRARSARPWGAFRPYTVPSLARRAMCRPKLQSLERGRSRTARGSTQAVLNRIRDELRRKACERSDRKSWHYRRQVACLSL